MNIELIMTVTVIGCVLAAHLVLSNWLLNRVQPTRLQMADLGAELLGSDHVSRRLKVVVAAMLDDAYDPYFMLFAVMKIPHALIRGKWRKSDWIDRIEDRHTRERFQDFVNFHFQSTAAANPLCAVAVALELAVGVLLYLCVGIIVNLPDAIFAATVRAEKQLHHAC
jgi:hypothetical protein